MKKFHTLILLFFSLSPYAQTVSTFYPNASVDDALAFDSQGNLYGSHYTGSIVWKFTPDGVRSKFMTGLDTPNGLAFDSNDNLYVIDNVGDAIYRVAPDSTVTDLVPNFFSPSGIVKMPQSDTMIVSSYVGDKLVKLAPDGVITDFVVGGLVNGPVGMAYDENEDLLVGNYEDRWIYKISPSGVLDTITLLNVPGNNIGFIAYRNGFIYATMIAGHTIYKIDLDGNYELFAGSSTPGNLDGDVSVAQFNAPNGIVLSPGGDSLYVSDFNPESIRIISNLDGTVSTDDFIHQSSITESAISPNPANEETLLNFELSKPQTLNISIFDINGQLVHSILDSKRLQAGTHHFTIHTDALPRGMYFIKMATTSGDEVVKKLVKN